MRKKLTPMMKQYWDIKNQYPDAVLFFRMGDFYEMFGEDARKAAPVLDIVLTSRDKNTDEKMPMCGVPHHAVESYTAKLIAKNFKVVICEQVEDPKTAKGIVKRDVVRVITPGTVLETNMLDARSNNYLASVAKYKKSGGIALLDISTGEFLVTETDEIAALNDELEQWTPAELVRPEGWDDYDPPRDIRVNACEDWVYSFDYAEDMIKRQLQIAGLDGVGLDDRPAAVLAAGALLHYVESTRVQDLKHVDGIRYFHGTDYVYLDPATRRNLELTRAIMGGSREGSLLEYIDLTITPMGARLLKKRMEKPLRSVRDINERLDFVEAFYTGDELRFQVREVLREIADLERLTARITTSVAHPKDLAALRDSLKQLPRLIKMLKAADKGFILDFVDTVDSLQDVFEILLNALRDDPPITLKDGNVIRHGYDAALDELQVAAKEGKQWIAGLQKTERERSGIPSLKVKFNKVFGYYIEVTKTHLDKIPDDYIRRQTLVNAERFVTPELKEMEEKILGAEEKQIALETKLFNALRGRIAEEAARLKDTAVKVAEVDVACALGELALNYRYRRPVVGDDDAIYMKNGRHPVVERIDSNEGFVPNDVHLDTRENRLMILTGPNMAGKSTYIRQVALIALMAQMGSFVPADEAHIGVVDRIFTRVGAADNLAGGQSTFMVEMSEAANILNNATRSSLIILDEIGRGTSTFDGLSIAWAVAEYLHGLGAKTLFATHYHELTDLVDRLEGVKNFNVEVREWNDQVMFLRKVVPGGVDRSYGIQVARLAGIPQSVIDRAKNVLESLESKEKQRVPEQRLQPAEQQPMQLELFAVETHEIIKKLKDIDPDALTPLDALKLLAEWKKEYF